jgi:hypothetical protein
LAQTFHFVDPVECTPGTASSWQDVDLDSYVASLGSDVTGVLLHVVNTNATTSYSMGLRKNGSTDNRTNSIYKSSHGWLAIGVDSSHIFEFYVGSTTDIDVYIVGYTTTGVTFATNATDKSLSTTSSWTDIDCSSQAPNAVGLIFEVVDTLVNNVGFRKNGSTDSRTKNIAYHCGVVIGCDTSQICEGYIANIDQDFYLLGYITDGITFNTNAVDRSLGSTGAYTDITLSSGAIGGIIEVTQSLASQTFAIRKNGSSEDIYKGAAYTYQFAIVEADSSRVIEGKISSTSVDFFEIGIATASASGPTGISEVDGIAVANIAEVNGIAWSGIDEVNTVT